MAAIFYIIGYIVVAIGLAWATFALIVPSVEVTSISIIARIIAASPGFGAIGGVLSRLDRLVRAAETEEPLLHTSVFRKGMNTDADRQERRV